MTTDSAGTEIVTGLRERRRLEREDAILEAARALMNEAGYDAMTMDSLASRAGLTKPTLYAYFPNKEALAVTSVVRMIQRGADALESRLTEHSAAARIEAFIRWVLNEKFVARRSPFPETLTAALHANADYRHMSEKLMARFAELVAEAQRDGDFSPDIAPYLAMRPFVSILRDSEYYELIRSGAVDPETLTETIATFLLRGLKSCP